MNIFASEPKLWSASSIALPPVDLIAATGLKLTIAATRLIWSEGNFNAASTLSPLLVTRFGGARGVEGLLATLSDPSGRRHMQEVDGLSGEVLHPEPALASALAAMNDIKRVERAVAVYNEWIGGFAASDPEHFVGVGIIPPTGLDAAMNALATAQRSGLKGMLLIHPPAGPGTAPGGDALAFWRRAAEGGTVISLNSAFGGAAPSVGPRICAGEAPAAGGFLSRLAFSGVSDEAKNLRLLLVNVEAGWLPHYLQNADLNYIRAVASRAVDLADPNALPSEYVRRSLWTTFHEDRFSVVHRDFFGEHHLMWGSALPTNDSNWPDDEQQVMRMCEGIATDSAQRLLADNVRRLFGIGNAPAFIAEEISAFRHPVLR